jgi:DUF971 family protein
MAADRRKTPTIKGLNEVGRYAVGIQWSDGHDSIYPLENLRRCCPCEECKGDVRIALAPPSLSLRQLVRLGEQSVFMSWGDGHETIYVLPRLRAICRCAYCVREPERPITGG